MTYPIELTYIGQLSLQYRKYDIGAIIFLSPILARDNEEILIEQWHTLVHH